MEVYCKKYERKRNELIPMAIGAAYEKAGPRPVKKVKETLKDHKRRAEAWGIVWNLEYHTTMNNLAKERGIC